MKKIIILLVVLSFFSCSKELDLKPNSTLVVPESAEELENLLDNTLVMNVTASLPQVSADEYYIPTVANFQALLDPITRSGYLWEPDIYKGKGLIEDWTSPYQQVFTCNSILDILNAQDIANDPNKQRIKGRALFSRAYAFYTLASTFCKSYDAATATTDMGIPLKLTSDVTEVLQRSSLQLTYDQIIKDALDASQLLQRDIPQDKKNRPSQVAAFAFLARVYLSMRKYDEAETYVDKSLALYPNLVDYNTLPVFANTTSFSYNFEETIYYSFNNDYGQTTFSPANLYGVDLPLLDLYSVSDLRKTIFFRRSATTGNYATKGIYNSQTNPFTGLATDELYLIKAECLARRGQTADALKYLNQLLVKRWNPNATTPARLYENVTAANAAEALDKILLERRKELVWRCLRWTDLKRLNLEGRNIRLTRNLGGTQYFLEPNSPLYVLPIPDDEIALSGIQQNQR